MSAPYSHGFEDYMEHDGRDASADGEPPELQRRVDSALALHVAKRPSHHCAECGFPVPCLTRVTLGGDA